MNVAAGKAVVTGGVLVTGAGSGIGRAAARAARGRGLVVVGAVRRSECAPELAAEGIVPVTMDVTDAAAVDLARIEVLEALDGRALSALVNSAGIGAVGPLESTPPEVLSELLAVNVVGAHTVTRAFLPELRAAHGRIVMVSSLCGRVALPFLGAYSASKFALEGLADTLRRELAASGVDVVVVQPAAVRTGIAARAWRAAVDAVGPADAPRYAAFLSRWTADAGRGIDPARVGEVIADLLTARRVPTRLVVPRHAAWRTRLLARLPDRWLDRRLTRGTPDD
jgi:NAD(P)-dependent dehydrogenase (short-subunit alcohol dehydrogenase family)